MNAYKSYYNEIAAEYGWNGEVAEVNTLAGQGRFWNRHPDTDHHFHHHLFAFPLYGRRSWWWRWRSRRSEKTQRWYDFLPWFIWRRRFRRWRFRRRRRWWLLRRRRFWRRRRGRSKLVSSKVEVVCLSPEVYTNKTAFRKSFCGTPFFIYTKRKRYSRCSGCMFNSTQKKAVIYVMRRNR